VPQVSKMATELSFVSEKWPPSASLGGAITSVLMPHSTGGSTAAWLEEASETAARAPASQHPTFRVFWH
jgi:hypothetical protein